ncbi:hypothetical protein FA15DRAFT_673998 [Coprinopsis marcescibilis]|uniref:Uncharacterized protein n=1 Tax=Coprinopsis marcescibilis TaxID=230819 RepID=A0A5C3KJ37_COPMA|nr:hypothetical protein FA15DRAFT_673998 [Coprinopsis marcescibilis]
MTSKGLLLDTAEHGSLVSETEFNEWYESNHTFAHLSQPGFNSAAIFKTHDGEKPSWVGVYELSSTAAVNRSHLTKRNGNEVFSKLESLDRGVFKLVHTVVSAKATPEVLNTTCPYLCVVESSVSDEVHDEYNKWYIEHCEDIATAPGCIRGRRYKLETREELAGKPQVGEHYQHRYVVIWEWDSDTYYTDERNPELLRAATTQESLAMLPRIKMVFRRFKLQRGYKKFEIQSPKNTN